MAIQVTVSRVETDAGAGHRRTRDGHAAIQADDERVEAPSEGQPCGADFRGAALDEGQSREPDTDERATGDRREEMRTCYAEDYLERDRECWQPKHRYARGTEKVQPPTCGITKGDADGEGL